MGHNSQNDAILLLTVSLGKSNSATAKPLSVNEWARFAAWLRERSLQPQDLLLGDLAGLFSGWSDKTITLPRVESLLGRGGALALRMAKWEGAGLRAITRADEEYPPLLKERLKAKSPPVLFISGNPALLNTGGFAVIGSRDASDEDCRFTTAFAAQAAAQNHSIVSGGARGIDRSAMLGALDSEGTSVGVLSSGLLTESASAKYRKHIMSGHLTLISPFNPEAEFNVGNAMSRNAYIYCLANAAVVVDSNFNNGGTWNGAVENLKYRWVPLWVKKNDRPSSGNFELTKRGGGWLPEELPDLSVLLGLQPPEMRTQTANAPKFSPVAGSESAGIPDALDFYHLFLKRMERMTIDKPLEANQIAEAIAVRPVQVDDWLKRGVSEKRIEKVSKPTRYRFWEVGNMLIED